MINLNRNITQQSFKPDKRLGQHFLNDRGIIERIIQCADLLPENRVLEIGPGQGALTVPLARSVESVIAVEKDARLIDGLKDRISRAGISNVSVINADILKLDLSEFAATEAKIKILGNLPYNISSPILEKLLNHRDIISQAVFMFQYEFAARLTAEPECKQYGALTVLTGYNARVSQMFNVSREVFFPKPKVGSMVVKIDLEKPHPRKARDEDIFRKVVRASFSSRRKTIVNSLKVIEKEFERDKVVRALDHCEIDSGRRAETLSIDDFICLADALC